jgi:predicted secreted protein
MNRLPVFFILNLAAAFITVVSAASPQAEWSQAYGGSYDDGVWSLQALADGFILAGYTCSNGRAGDLWLVRTDLQGRMLWNGIYGGSGEDIGYSVHQTDDQGFVATGSTRSFGLGEERLWLIKVSSNGKKMWDRTFGGFVSSAGDGGWSVDVTTDGGFIVTGYSRSFGAGGKDLWLIKTDASGNEQWSKTFGGQKDDVGMSVLQTKDNGYIAAGRTASYGAGGDDIWLVKVSSAGTEQWNATFGGTKDDVGFQVVELADGYALIGRTDSDTSGNRAILIRTDKAGKKQWERIYRGNTALSLQETRDGGFIIAARIDTPSSGKDALLIKADAAGNLQWSMPLGGPGEEIGSAVVETADGYAMAGITSSFGAGAEDAWLVRISPELPGSLDGSGARNSSAAVQVAGAMGQASTPPPRNLAAPIEGIH